MSNELAQSYKTEVGTAKWAKVNTVVDTYEGKETGYSMNVYFSKAYTEALKVMFKQIIETAKESGEFTTPKGKIKEFRKDFRTPIHTDDDGNEFVVFKTNHLDKDGNRKFIKMFDKFGHDLGNEITIGNGSKVIVSFTPKAYNLTSENNGVKLYLNGIQILDLITFGGSDAESFGFEVVPEGNGEENEENTLI